MTEVTLQNASSRSDACYSDRQQPTLTKGETMAEFTEAETTEEEEPEMATCDWCGQTELAEDLIQSDNCTDGYCEPCWEHFTECEACCRMEHEERLDYFGHCEECAEDYGTCDYCGDMYHTDDLNWNERTEMANCEHCRGEGGAVSPDSTRPTRCHYCRSEAVGRGFYSEELVCAEHLTSHEPSGTLAELEHVMSPLVFTYGVEMEISRDDTEGASRMLHALKAAGLTSQDYLHPYHCGCYTCSNEDIAPQEDCTAEAEYVTRTLRSDSIGDSLLFAKVTTALSEAGALVEGEVGAHTNIGKQVKVQNSEPYVELREDAPVRTERRAEWRLHVLLALYREDLEKLASQGQGRLRRYNNAPDWNRSALCQEALVRATNALDTMTSEQWRIAYPSACGWNGSPAQIQHLISTRWLTDKGGWWEFRVWSGTRNTWRAAMSVEVSASMVAFAESSTPLPLEGDALPMEALLGEYLTPKALGWMEAQFAA